jgi:hypothetical protein
MPRKRLLFKLIDCGNNDSHTILSLEQYKNILSSFNTQKEQGERDFRVSLAKQQNFIVVAAPVVSPSDTLTQRENSFLVRALRRTGAAGPWWRHGRRKATQRLSSSNRLYRTLSMHKVHGVKQLKQTWNTHRHYKTCPQQQIFATNRLASWESENQVEVVLTPTRSRLFAPVVMGLNFLFLKFVRIQNFNSLFSDVGSF